MPRTGALSRDRRALSLHFALGGIPKTLFAPSELVLQATSAAEEDGSRSRANVILDFDDDLLPIASMRLGGAAVRTAGVASWTGAKVAQWHAMGTVGDGDCLLSSVILCIVGLVDKTAAARLRQQIHSMMVDPVLGPKLKGLWQASLPAGVHDGWEREVEAAITPNAWLASIHVLVMSHVLRRPIVVFDAGSAASRDMEVERVCGIYRPSLFTPPQNHTSPAPPSPLVVGYQVNMLPRF